MSCNEKGKNVQSKPENPISNDSIELTNLTKKVYEWYMNDENDEFPYQYLKNQDTIYSGIDWQKYEISIKKFEKTNFFTKEFYSKHRDIAQKLDVSIKKTDVKWRNINDGIPTWESGADNWCNCQDYPDNYWKIIRIDSLKIYNEIANFIWTWDKETSKDSHTYKITAKKENGVWKINYLAGFENYYSVEEYDKMIQELLKN